MRSFSIFVMFAASSFSTGCTSIVAKSLSGRGFDASPMTTEVRRPLQVSTLDLINSALDRTSADSKYKTMYEALVAFDSKQVDAIQVNKRNAILHALLLSSENSCATYVLDLRGYRITLNSTAGIFDSLVNAAGIATTDLSTGQSLAAVSSFITSGVGSVSKNAWGDLASELIAKKIIDGRTTFRASFFKRISDASTVATYNQLTLAEGLAELTRYHGMCSARYGVTELQKEAAK